MKYITIFHANLNYAYLTPDRYEFVIRTAYEMTLDTMREEFPDTKFVFEASGYTLEQMALRTPDVLEKLKVCFRSHVADPGSGRSRRVEAAELVTGADGMSNS